MKKLKYLILCIALTAISCGVPALAPLAKPAPAAISAPDPNNMVVRFVCHSGGLNVRVAPAGDHAGKWLYDGQRVIVLVPATIAEDMGVWYELDGGGWVNGRYLCQ